MIDHHPDVVPARSQLILGPFMGKVACQTIKVGRGVCGAAAEGDGRTVVVKDVHEFPGHIACDGDSRSEIVVPIRDGEGKVSEWDFFDISCRVLSHRLTNHLVCVCLGRRCHRYRLYRGKWI